MNPGALLALVGRGLGWKLAADMLGRLLQYSLLWLAARLLLPAEFGDFTFALSAGLMLSQIADFGLQLYAQRELARLVMPGQPRGFIDEGRAASVVGGGLVVKAVLMLMALALLAVATVLEPVGNRGAVFLVGASVVLLTALDYLAFCFRALGQLQQEARAYVLCRGINVVLGAGMLFGGAGIGGLAAAGCVSALVAVGYSYNRLLGYLRPTWKLDTAAWRAGAMQPFAIGFGIVLSMAAFRVDNLLIPPSVGAAHAGEALGAYNAAYKLFELSLVVPGAVLAATFPLLSRAAHAPDGTFGRLLAQVLGALVSLGAVASLVLWAGASPIIRLLYGESFAPSVGVLQWLALGCLPMYASYSLTHALLALDRPRLYAGFAGVALAANITANLVLLPIMGVAGAAVATLLTELTMVGLCSAALLRLRAATSGLGVLTGVKHANASTRAGEVL